ncbi:MAG: Holliday junction branch migration DNA helicase RuvB [Phycisphaerae bacterium]
MPRERIIAAAAQIADDEHVNVALRPRTLGECVGQHEVIDQLRIAIDAARQRGEPLEHILLDGPPGLGKTTLAHVIAHEVGRADRVRVTSGPAIAKQADLMSTLTNLETGDILFIDEVHRLNRVVEEFLYPAMEDFRVDYTIEGGVGGRTANFRLNRFTLIGATTRAGMLSNAMRDRFGLRYHLDFYDEADLTEILRRSAKRLELTADDAAMTLLARRSRGTPRVANRLLRRARDYAQVRANGALNAPVVEKALEIQQIDGLGLDELDRAYLSALMRTYDGGPAGIEALAATMGQERDTLEDMVEPYLLQIGFVTRTRQGRCATRAAFDHLGLPYTEGRRSASGDQNDLF